MKVADFVINYLGEYGIKDAFVVSGAANAYLIDAFTRTDKIRYVAMMHEQAAGFAAEGYAKISGKPGLAIATSGPGGMNLVTPIGNCFYDSVPSIFLTGQINADFLRKDPSIRQVGFQETDIVSIVSPIVKYAKLIRNPEEIKFELEKALYIAQEGRPGPVLLDIPQNIQNKEIDPEKLVGFNREIAKKSYNVEVVREKVRRYLDDLSRAKRPVLLIGGGVRTGNAVELLLQVGRVLKIPMFPTWNAIDVVTSDYEFYGGRIGTYGGRGRNFGIQNTDLLLSIGSRISGRITGGNTKSFARAAKKYLVDVDEALVQQKWQEVPFDENIFCDAKLFLEILNEELKGKPLPDTTSWTAQVMTWKEKYDPVRKEYYEQKAFVNPYVFIRKFSELMNKNDILAADCGGNIVVTNQALETKQGQRYFSNNGNSPMGFSFAGAFGAECAAESDQKTFCIIGDGGFNMNIQELQTLITYGSKLKTFIINNHVYGIIRAFQETNVEGRYEASGPKGYVAPDFVKIAEAYGVKTITIKNNEELESKLKEVIAYDGPVVCDVDCGDWMTYEPRIFGWKTPIEDMYPYLPREEFRANLFIEPVADWENPVLPGIQGPKKERPTTME